MLVEQEEDLVWYFTFYLDAPANQDDACKSRKLSIYERGNRVYQSFGKFTNNNLLSLGIQRANELRDRCFIFLIYLIPFRME